MSVEVLETPVERRLLSVAETARVLGIGRTKAYELVADGTLPSVQIGSIRRVSVAALDRWIEALGDADE